jgi:hypothetical protein
MTYAMEKSSELKDARAILSPGLTSIASDEDSTTAIMTCNTLTNYVV